MWFETNHIVDYSLTFFCKFIWSFHAGESKVTTNTVNMSLLHFGSFAGR